MEKTKEQIIDVPQRVLPSYYTSRKPEVLVLAFPQKIQATDGILDSVLDSTLV